MGEVGGVNARPLVILCLSACKGGSVRCLPRPPRINTNGETTAAISPCLQHQALLLRTVGELEAAEVRPLVILSLSACKGGSVRCLPRLHQAINVIGGGPTALH